MPTEWFDAPDPSTGAPGLRFACTMCGNCCSGPEGYVLVSDAEADALAARLGIPRDQFLTDYTHLTREGRSLNEKPSPSGLDCVFLDRNAIPGKAICSVYEDRPAQCRTWPFWSSVIRSRRSWDAASRTCPGINKGAFYPPEQIRILRARVQI